MEEKIKRVVEAALQRNTFTADQPIEISVRGRVVILTGSVSHEDLIYEAVATAESVSPKLRIYSSLKVNKGTTKADV
jgi:osmotically-inducible protein OsmY